MANKGSGFTLSTKGLDDLFSTQTIRDEEKLVRIRDIPLNKIAPFPGHPFKVQDDEDMMKLAQSVRERGVVTPATVRQKPDGGYELISGHRRKRACELAGLTTLRCEVVEIDDDEAVIRMVESNFYREKILPSEKAFSYKMRLEAMKRQGQRTDLTSTPLVSKLRADEKLADIVGESREQIRRYIRLTELIPPLLDMADSDRLKLRPAVELSYLDRESQEHFAESGVAPTCAQAKKLREAFEENGTLSAGDVRQLLSAQKPVQKDGAPTLSGRLRQYIPSSVKQKDVEDYICKALEHYQRFLLEQ